MSRFLLILLLISLSACAPQPTPTTITEPAPSTVIEPAQTQALQIPAPSDWAGAISHPDGTSESMSVHLDTTKGTLNIEPKVKTYEFENIQGLGSKISFKVTAENEMTFSGEYDGSQIHGQVEENGQADSFTLFSLFSEPKESLNDFLGTYQFESGESLLINLAPEYNSSGLYFFGQGLMVTHFGTGAIRALYPIASDTFLVGSARAVGYPFAEQMTFARDSNGHVTGLIWRTRDPKTGNLGETERATRLALKSEVVHFPSEDGTNLTGLLNLPATPGPYPAIMMVHGSEPGTKDDFGDQQMSAFMASGGIAILTYDKRGVGDSGGHYSESASETNLNLTAQDAIAGLKYLRSRSEISGN